MQECRQQLAVKQSACGSNNTSITSHLLAPAAATCAAGGHIALAEPPSCVSTTAQHGSRYFLQQCSCNVTAKP
jgi:hypothetical protein